MGPLPPPWRIRGDESERESESDSESDLELESEFRSSLWTTSSAARGGETSWEKTQGLSDEPAMQS